MMHSRSVFNVLTTKASTGASAGLSNWRAPRFTRDGCSQTIYTVNYGDQPSLASASHSLRGDAPITEQNIFYRGHVMEWLNFIVRDWTKVRQRMCCQAQRPTPSVRGTWKLDTSWLFETFPNMSDWDAGISPSLRGYNTCICHYKLLYFKLLFESRTFWRLIVVFSL